MKNTPQSLEKRKKLRAYWKKTIDPKTVPLYIDGLCKDCLKESKLRWTTTFLQTGKPSYWGRCDDCRRKYLNGQQAKVRKRLVIYAKKRRNAGKDKCIEYLGGKCVRCGYDKVRRALTFHHKKRNDKTRDLCGMFDHSWDKIKKELDKCILVCFNCHMELEEEYEVNKRTGNECSA